MHGGKKINNYWLSRYSIRKVYYGDNSFKQTLKYLKKQKYLNYSKIYFLLNSFLNKNYSVFYILNK